MTTQLKSLLILCFAALLLLAFRPAVAQTAADPAPATGRVVHIRFTTQAEVNRLAGKYDVWAVDYQQHVITAYLTSAELSQVRAAGYRIASEAAPVTMLPFAPLNGAAVTSVPNYACYRTLDETYASLQKLATDHPNLAQWIDIGDSWDKVQGKGGEDIFALVLTSDVFPKPKPRFFLMAAIHAREMATAEVATRFAEQLVNGYGVDPEITWLLDYNEIHIVAQANPDGRKKAEASTPGQIASPNYLWRKNVNSNLCSAGQYGVDLNRNSSFEWNGCLESGDCSSSYACDLTYRGTGPASEPETQALENYMKAIFADQRGPALTDAAPADTTGIMVSLHSYSQLILFPWGWTSAHAPNDQQLRTLGGKFGYFTGYGVCQSGEFGCLYQTDGTSDDFAYGELGVAAYTYELGTNFFESCSSFESVTLPNTLHALLYAAKSARRPYQTPAGPDVTNVLVTSTLTSTQVVAGTCVTLTATVDSTRTSSNARSEPAQNIAAASYTVDRPDWFAGAIPAALTPVDVFDSGVETATAAIDTAGWSTGRHTVFVTGANVAGNHGAPTAVFIDIGPQTGSPAQDLPLAPRQPCGTTISVFMPFVGKQ